MKTAEPIPMKADPVISELWRTKAALAEKHGYDVLAMIRALRSRDATEAPHSAIQPAALKPRK